MISMLKYFRQTGVRPVLFFDKLGMKHSQSEVSFGTLSPSRAPLWDAYAQVIRSMMAAVIGIVILIVLAIAGFVVHAMFKPMSDAEYDKQRARISDDKDLSTYDKENATARLRNKYEDSHTKWPRRTALGVSSLMVLIALIVAFNSTFTTVPTKDIGITTAFGAPTGYLTNGAHFKAPWEDVTLMDGAIQTDTHNKIPDHEDCIKVRIAHQIVACANTYVKWQVNETSVDNLFQNYRAFDNIRDSLVTKNLQSVLNEVFASYDPLSVDPKTGASDAPELSILSKQALAQTQTAVGNNIKVFELAVTVLNYDDSTQSKINALQGQVAQTRIAEQAVQTAQQQAYANEKLAASVSNTPNVLVSKCLDMVAEGKAALPAGFSCWPGGSSAVVVPSAATK